MQTMAKNVHPRFAVPTATILIVDHQIRFFQASFRCQRWHGRLLDGHPANDRLRGRGWTSGTGECSLIIFIWPLLVSVRVFLLVIGLWPRLSRVKSFTIKQIGYIETTLDRPLFGFYGAVDVHILRHRQRNFCRAKQCSRLDDQFLRQRGRSRLRRHPSLSYWHHPINYWFIEFR